METGGLLVDLGKVNAWMIRLLCDNPWDGGGGHQPRDVAQWTPDQIWFRLCDRGLLKLGGRTQSMEPLEVRVDEEGIVMGRTPDGEPIKGRIAGKSLARQLMEKAEAKKVLEKASTLAANEDERFC